MSAQTSTEAHKKQSMSNTPAGTIPLSGSRKPGNRWTAQVLGRGDYLQFESDAAPKRGNEISKPAGVSEESVTELGSTDFESWAQESFEIATKIAYRNGEGRIGFRGAGVWIARWSQRTPCIP